MFTTVRTMSQRWGIYDISKSTIGFSPAFSCFCYSSPSIHWRYRHRYWFLIGFNSASAREPLILRLSIDPQDPYWAIVQRIQQTEKEAEEDLPYDLITQELNNCKEEGLEVPLFRIRFFDETNESTESFIRSTSLTSDITFFVTRPPASARESITPGILLRIIYNSLLFIATRISSIVDQLSVLTTRKWLH